MEQSLLEAVILWVVSVISTLGYPGIFFLMTLESVLVPIPSEVIMPFSGFLVSQGRFDLWAIVLVGALGNLAGSLIAYYLGYFGKEVLVRKLIVRYGKFILLTEEEFDHSLKLFSKYGQWLAAISRITPVIRTIISLPAGIAKLPIWKFSLLTFTGSLIWSLFLAYLGAVLGENWQEVTPYFRKFDIVILSITIILIGVYLFYKLRQKKLGVQKT